MRRLAPLVVVVALGATAQAFAASDPSPPTRESCRWLIRDGEGVTPVAAPNLKLVGTNDPLAQPAGDVRLEAVYCERDSLVPDAWDDRVPRTLGVPLMIRGPGGLATVMIKNGRFRVAFSREVRVTPSLRTAARRHVDRWQARPSPVR